MVETDCSSVGHELLVGCDDKPVCHKLSVTCDNEPVVCDPTPQSDFSKIEQKLTF